MSTRLSSHDIMPSSRSSCTPSDSPGPGVIPISRLASATAGIAGVAGAILSSRWSRSSLSLKIMGAGAAAASRFGEAWGAAVSR